jgi:hypothetical protein
MCVDNSFCSTSCRDKHLQYIRNIDPDFDYPHKWNENKIFNTRINCIIEVDYFNINDKSIKKMNHTKSLCDFKKFKSEKMIITCINFYKFNIKISNKMYKILLAGGLFITMLSILIKILV